MNHLLLTDLDEKRQKAHPIAPSLFAVVVAVTMHFFTCFALTDNSCLLSRPAFFLFFVSLLQFFFLLLHLHSIHFCTFHTRSENHQQNAPLYAMLWTERGCGSSSREVVLMDYAATAGYVVFIVLCAHWTGVFVLVLCFVCMSGRLHFLLVSSSPTGHKESPLFPIRLYLQFRILVSRGVFTSQHFYFFLDNFFLIVVFMS